LALTSRVGEPEFERHHLASHASGQVSHAALGHALTHLRRMRLLNDKLVTLVPMMMLERLSQLERAAFPHNALPVLFDVASGVSFGEFTETISREVLVPTFRPRPGPAFLPNPLARCAMRDSAPWRE
jgi:hypothetical protein